MDREEPARGASLLVRWRGLVRSSPCLRGPRTDFPHTIMLFSIVYREGALQEPTVHACGAVVWVSFACTHSADQNKPAVVFRSVPPSLLIYVIMLRLVLVAV